jgi:hypothetical protein
MTDPLPPKKEEEETLAQEANTFWNSLTYIHKSEQAIDFTFTLLVN